jgi:hypothetical protein
MKRLTIPSSAVLLLTFILATPVLAAAPGNDGFAGRTVIAGLPYTQTLDTSEATSEASDAELNTECGAPALDASVWYELTAPADMAILVDVSQSDYSAGVFVATGSPGAFGPVVACGPGLVVFPAQSGTTYVLMVIDDQLDGGGNGGTLQLQVSEAPPPPEIDVTVDPVARFNAQTGSVTLTGTVTCTADAFAFIDASLSQTVGRFTVRGFGFIEMPCDGTAQPWSLEILGETGLFKGGHAVAVTFGQACDFDCGFDFAETTVRLRR